MAPSLAFEQARPSKAQPVAANAGLEFTDPVMLTSKCDQIGNSWGVAAGDVGLKELPALGEANSVDCRGLREDGVGGEIDADFFDLLR